MVIGVNPGYARHQSRTRRQIPIVLLTPIDACSSARARTVFLARPCSSARAGTVVLARPRGGSVRLVTDAPRVA